MTTVVPAEITTELACILSNLVLPDNEIRSAYVIFKNFGLFQRVLINNCPLSAEKTLDERLLHAPETLILALAQSSVSASTETVSSPVLCRFLPTCYLYYEC